MSEVALTRSSFSLPAHKQQPSTPSSAVSTAGQVICLCAYTDYILIKTPKTGTPFPETEFFLCVPSHSPLISPWTANSVVDHKLETPNLD